MPKSSSKSSPKTPPWRVRDAIKAPFTLDLVWVVLPFALVLLCFGMLPLRSWDYWWHITMGRLIDVYRSVPAANHFLYTLDAEAPSYIQPWISQWVFYWLHDVGGLQLSLLVRNLISATVFGLIGFEAMRRSHSAMRGALLALLGFVLAISYIAARTHLFVLPLFGLLLWLGFRVRQRQFPLPVLILFPAAAALWANLHGSFLMPAAICLAFGVAALCDRFDRRAPTADFPKHAFSRNRAVAWLAAFLLSLVAPLLNPRGAEVYGYIIDLSTNAEIQNTVSEWMATTLASPAGIGAIFYATLIGGAALFWLNRRAVDPADVFLFAGFALLAIVASRGVLWFALVTPLVLARYIRERPDADSSADADLPPGWMRVVNFTLALGLLVVAAVLQPGTVPHRDFVSAYQPIPTRVDPPLAGLVEAETPVIATAILKQYPANIRVFHDQKYAGYLLYHLTNSRPAQRVFVDQRIELPPPKIWRLYDLANSSSAWKGIFQQFDVGAALLNKSSQPKLVEALRETPGWELLYENEHNALFMAEN